MYVLMPCAGLYKRYPSNEMPKYIRPLNDMRPMFSWALDGIRTLTSNKICFAIRKNDEDEWHVSNIIKNYENAEVLILDYNTNGPAETVYEMLKYFDINESFLIHDCDCTWKPQNENWDKNENQIFVGWRETAIGDRGSKSWIFTNNDKVTKIEEKRSITDWYCCGGYLFSNPKKFKSLFESFNKNNEIFCSHIIQTMIDSGDIFRWVECGDFNDWGTYEKYVAWRKKRKIYFFDLDGTLCEAGGPYGKKEWNNVNILPGVKEKLKELKEKNNYIIIVTSRPLEQKNLTLNFLKENNICYDNILFGIPNGSRVMINDYAKSNPYPAVEALNTKRNTADWLEML